MTTTTTGMNGKVRRSLAEQIDRLDQVLDGLSDNLNDAVAAAVKEATTQAVRQAVHQALAEVLTNPDVLTLIGGAARLHAPPSPQPASGGPGLGERLGAVRDWAGKQLQAAQTACGIGASLGLRALGGLASKLRTLWRCRTQFLVGLGVGAAVGVAGYFAGPWVAGLLTGLAGFASALAVQARLWLGRALGDFAAASGL